MAYRQVYAGKGTPARGGESGGFDPAYVEPADTGGAAFSGGGGPAGGASGAAGGRGEFWRMSLNCASFAKFRKFR